MKFQKLVMTFSSVLITSTQGLAATGLPLQTQSLAALPSVQRYIRTSHYALVQMSASQRREAFSYRDAKGERRDLYQETSNPLEKAWAHQDLDRDRIPGTSTSRAYAELSLQTPSTPVTVAVIDSGIDVTHEDLASQIWGNTAELNGIAGVDDDGNGFIDDFHGWNFLGHKNGTDLIQCNLEVTRELARMLRLKAAADAANSTLNDAELNYLFQLQASFDDQKRDGQATVQNFKTRLNELQTSVDVLKSAGLIEETLQAVQDFQTSDPTLLEARDIALFYLRAGLSSAVLKRRIAELELSQQAYYDLNFDPSSLIGDSDRLDEIGYGNNHIITHTADHGTHVAGIIGALRTNGLGMDGQAGQPDFVKIMPLRAVPDGDERDKDVANAIRYAVSQGARVINMSFGKTLSPHKSYVDSAIEYAEARGVLIVQAAGNSASDNDRLEHFPNRTFRKEGRVFSNYLVVGASTATADSKLPASFSNYGLQSVDLFAPGAQIISTIPGNQYASKNGTSMAAPEVAGVAALLLSQHPELTPAELRAILMHSSRKFPALYVKKPGGGLIDFAGLSQSGGVLNAYEALKMAAAPLKSIFAR